MLFSSCPGDEQLAKGSHGNKDQADFGGYDLEINFPKDVEVAFPFEATGAGDGKDDDDDGEAEGAS